MTGCRLNLKVTQITSDPLSSRAFSCTHLWNRIGLLWEISFSWSLSVFSTASTCLNLALRPRLQTCTARSLSQVSQLAVVSKAWVHTKTAGKGPAPGSCGQCENHYQLYERFLPFWLAQTACQVHGWKTFIYQTYWEQCPANHFKARKNAWPRLPSKKVIMLIKAWHCNIYPEPVQILIL